ncbi:MAG: hypothetical protein A3J27_08150 [Candidatus Tectomicrobia bacterium RIFCSPLOWO2_12_FULL_69_37]|nr:MAG: hypothetical protein A3J27_08150 [Candidatus Tectomicrobia bacterium RIFCSPLOWO2_12_FULL_69_37]OGL62826.1 MAG: hypothetical protein A3I72_05435 [Candidatus Tectomicrobia bacterium RIFCSPLOWO2_02_FULL_70_19]
MATTPIPPQGFTPLSKTAPPATGREAAPRTAAVPRPHGAAPSLPARPAETLELQLARIFARHAMQQQAHQPKAVETPALASGKIRGGNLDILA